MPSYEGEELPILININKKNHSFGRRTKKEKRKNSGKLKKRLPIIVIPLSLSTFVYIYIYRYYRQLGVFCWPCSCLAKLPSHAFLFLLCVVFLPSPPFPMGIHRCLSVCSGLMLSDFFSLFVSHGSTSSCHAAHDI